MASVRELIENRQVFTVARHSTVQSAAEFMALRNIGAVCVMDRSLLVGIFSERDMINRVVAKRLDPEATPVSAVMTADLVVATADETYEVCLMKMKHAGCRHLPIVEGDRLLGIISLRDLLQVEILEKSDKIEFLHNYMFHVPSLTQR